MSLSLRQIEVFRAIMRAGTLTEAARLLGVSQPAMSRVLRHAEDRLGLLLFERRKGRLHPTPEARALYPEIEKIYVDLDYVHRAAIDLRSLQGGRLAIAAIPSLAATIVAAAIGRFARERPNVAFNVQGVALNYDVAEILHARQAELGFVFGPSDHPELVADEIGTTELICLMPPDHPLAANELVRPGDIAPYPLISFGRTLPIGAMIEAAFLEEGVARRIAVEVGQSFVAVALIRAGAGLAVVDDLVLRSGIAAGLAAKPFRPRKPITMNVLTRRGERQSLLAQAFLDELCSAIP